MPIRLVLMVVFGLGLFVSLRVWAAPTIEHWTTSNGVRVYYIHAPELPMVDIQLVFDAGSARDGRKLGLAMMTNHLLDMGAGEWDEETIIQRFESIGARYSSDSLRDMASVSLRSLSDDRMLRQALETLTAIVSEPLFKQDILERERQQTLIALKAEADDPGAIAERAFYTALYKKHPYASAPMGDPKTISRISRLDVQAFHRQYYVARNAVLAIVGDVSRQQAEKIAQQLTQGLPQGKAAAALPGPKALNKARVVNIAHDSQQSHVLMGYMGISRDDPDYMALYVGNHILGGSGFGSRILEEIREKRGLSYSAYSYFYPMRVSGPFLMGLQTRNDKLEEADSVLRHTLREFIEHGPSNDELEAARQNITGGFPLRIDSNKDKLAYLSMIGFYGLPLDYLDTFNTRVEAVTVEQIQQAFARRIDPDKLVSVVVGGKK